MTCFRCGRPASITLKIDAIVDNQRLKLAQNASDNAVCSSCMIELAEWVKAGRPDVPVSDLWAVG